MLTRKHYVKIADVLATNLRESSSDAERERVRVVARDMAKYFQADNPNFNADVFGRHVRYGKNEPR